MGIIRQLPASVINQIAAGEVVERPASVLKELLENAIDAGATRVDVTVERGGKDLIRVADDGKGMSPEDLPLAFTPHATSKLVEADDLFRIRTLGFRGEALAAIAEVSKVCCQTRTADAEAGSELSINAGVAAPIKPCGCAVGTVIEVRHLFHNTPVRRTYLKSDSTEAGHVIEMFTRIALAHPTVHLTYRSGGKVLHDLPAVTGVKDRIGVFFGRELSDSLLWVESQFDRTHLWGYVGHPSQSRSSNKGQFLFISGRYVRDRSLGHALSEAFRGLLMVGRSPVAFLHLDVPPDEVDVNVHPTKVEVRFRDGQKIYSQLLATLRQTFLSSDLHSRLQVPAESQTNPSRPGAPEFALAERPSERQDVASWFTPSTPSTFQNFPTPGYAGGPPAASPDWSRTASNYASTYGPPPPSAPAPPPSLDFDEFAPPPGAGSQTNPTPPGAEFQTNPMPPPAAGAPPLAGFRPEAGTREAVADDLPVRAIQVHDTYLIAETSDGMVVIDQHALHERILYEELRARIERGGVESQRLLVPEPIEMGAPEAAAILERRDALAKLGIEVEPFGGDTILVSSTPAMLPGVPPERLIRDLADHFRSRPIPPTPDAMLEDVLSMIACKAAVKANQKLAPDEITALLERRHLVGDSHHCPHGRPTALVFSKTELERQFGRI
ncbi:DNA mismatch repair endonuclease MutL [Tundrisphaera sp. TA3]|uniref:DNA mismatch repair endonuclease MutL n=1 Tax=Tundrisphaera sp. TA3 TaxID=3435775 RepID=UPI003EC02661